MRTVTTVLLCMALSAIGQSDIRHGTVQGFSGTSAANGTAGILQSPEDVYATCLNQTIAFQGVGHIFKANGLATGAEYTRNGTVTAAVTLLDRDYGITITNYSVHCRLDYTDATLRGRQPKSWTLSASNAATGWSVIDVQTNQGFAAADTSNHYTVATLLPNATSWRWIVTENSNSVYIYLRMIVRYADDPVTPNIHGYASDKRLDGPTSGDLAYRRPTSTTTNTGAVVWTNEARRGMAAYFNGGTLVSTRITNLLVNTGGAGYYELTRSMWLYNPDAHQTNSFAEPDRTTLASHGSGFVGPSLASWLSQPSLSATLRDNAFTVSRNLPVRSRWTHIAYTINQRAGTNFVYYVDGQPYAITKAAGSAVELGDNAPGVLGGAAGGWIGIIDEVQHIHRALPAVEMQQLYAGVWRKNHLQTISKSTATSKSNLED